MTELCCSRLVFVCVVSCVSGRCSVLVKVTPDLNDLLVGHTTWWTYTAMTRIYKHYNFELQGSQYKAHLTSMSSYPGMVSSMVSELPCGNPISGLCS